MLIPKCHDPEGDLIEYKVSTQDTLATFEVNYLIFQD